MEATEKVAKLYEEYICEMIRVKDIKTAEAEIFHQADHKRATLNKSLKSKTRG